MTERGVFRTCAKCMTCKITFVAVPFSEIRNINEIPGWMKQCIQLICWEEQRKTFFLWAYYVARSCGRVDYGGAASHGLYPAITLWVPRNSSVSYTAMSYEHWATLKLNLFKQNLRYSYQIHSRVARTLIWTTRFATCLYNFREIV